MWMVKQYDDHGNVIASSKVPKWLAYFVERKAKKGYISRTRENDMGRQNRFLVYVD
jgi:hypothetical protein